MAIKTQLRLNQMTASFGTASGKINDGGFNPDVENKAALDGPGGIGTIDLSGSLSFLATAIRRTHGGADFSDQTAGLFSHATSTFTGDIEVNGGDLTVKAANDGVANLVLQADNNDDDGDQWQISAVDNQTFSLLNNKSGSPVSHLTITPDATVANSVVEVIGKLRLSGDTIENDAGAVVIATTGDVDTGNITLASGDGNTVITNSVTIGGDIVGDANEAKAIFAASTSAASTITIGGGGDVVVGGSGDLKLSTSGLINDSGGHARFAAPDGTATLIKDIDGTTVITVHASDLSTTLAGDLTVTGNTIAGSGGSAIEFSGVNTQLIGDLKVAGNDIQDNSGNAALTFDGSANVTVPNNLIIDGNLTVKGTEHIIDVDNLRIKDPVIAFAAGSITANSNGGLSLISGSSRTGAAGGNMTTAIPSDMVIGRVAVNTWGAGVMDTQSGSITSMTSMAFANMRVRNLELSGSANYLAFDGTDLKMIAGADIVLDPAGNNVLPGSNNADDLGASGTAWKKIWALDLDVANGDISNVGSIEVDSVIVADAANGLDIVFGGATTTNKLSLTDNLAEALTIEQGGNDYMKFATTNSSELITFGKNSTFAGTTIANLGTVSAATSITSTLFTGPIDGVLGGNTPAAGTVTTLTANTALRPDTAGGATLGADGIGWGTLYIADDQKISFGNGNDATVEYDEDGTDELRFAGAAATFEQAVTFDGAVTLGNATGDTVTVLGNSTFAGTTIANLGTVSAATSITSTLFTGPIDGAVGGNTPSTVVGTTITANTVVRPDVKGGADLGLDGIGWGDVYIDDDKKIKFGAGNDATIEYDEDGTDELRFAGADVTFEQAVTFDGATTLGNASGDTVTVLGNSTFAGTTIANLGTVSAATSITSTNFVGATDGVLGGVTPAAATVTRLSIDGANNYLDVVTDMQLVAVADILLDAGGNDVLMQGAANNPFLDLNRAGAGEAYVNFSTNDANAIVGGSGGFGFWNDEGVMRFKNSGGSWQAFGSGGASKDESVMTASIGAGTRVFGGSTKGFDVSSVATNTNNVVDVYINGQLMLSGGTPSSITNDYALDATPNGNSDCDIRFNFDLADDDVLTVTVR